MARYKLDVTVAMTVTIEAPSEESAIDIFETDPLLVMWNEGENVDMSEVDSITKEDLFG